MCGIFGIAFGQTKKISSPVVRTLLTGLFRLSESRGKESAGIAIMDERNIGLYKAPIPASQLLKNKTYRRMLNSFLETKSFPKAVIGHSRLVTTGSEEDNTNNHPILKYNVVGVHNGIIVNAEELWNVFREIEREFEVDTEILLGIIGKEYHETGSIIKSVQTAFSEIQGTAAIAAIFADTRSVLLATNNGSLYSYYNDNLQLHVFASERYILEQLAGIRGLRNLVEKSDIIPVRPGEGRIIDLTTMKCEDFSLDSNHQSSSIESVPLEEPRKIIDYSPVMLSRTSSNHTHVSNQDASLLRDFVEESSEIRRCKKCILPETFPFISFDDNGVCNYCRNYQKPQLMGSKALNYFVDRFKKDEEPDCLVMISGGRDSVYALHYMKTVLDMNPVAYTYDWGMVTDLARRNIARICAELGIEHILLSADIRKKRANIRKNVLAWLRRPDLGTIPLFMAGDKQYFYYANTVMQRIGIDLAVLSANQYERTHFKTGFCGVEPNLGGKKDISGIVNEMKLASYYARRAIMNPAYINSTLLDTLFGLASYYNIPHSYLRLYDYIAWDEGEIISTLVDEYDWETASDTTLTWRIGDGTAPFYNYIYYTMAGFTENDTFRSNQIRNGVMDRETALKKVREENKPRYEGIRWYLNAIGLGNNFNSIIKRINESSRLE